MNPSNAAIATNTTVTTAVLVVHLGTLGQTVNPPLPHPLQKQGARGAALLETPVLGVMSAWERKWCGDLRQSGLSVATFNILADGWVDGEKHAACFPNILDSSRERLESVLDHLRGRDATVQSRVADSGRTISRAGRFSQK
jgi:hypothetical protein